MGRTGKAGFGLPVTDSLPRNTKKGGEDALRLALCARHDSKILRAGIDRTWL